MTYASRNRRRHGRLPGRDYGQAATYFVTICTFERIYWFGAVERQQMILNPFGQFAHDLWFDLPRRWPHVSLGAFQVMPNHVHGVLTIGQTASTYGAATMAAPTSHCTGDAGTPPMEKNDGFTAQLRVATISVHRQVGAALVAASGGEPSFASLYTPPYRGADTLPETAFSKRQWATRPTLPQIIGAYKSVVASACLRWHKANQPGVWIDPIWQRSYHETEITQHWVGDNVARYICRNPANWATDFLR